MSFSSDPWVQTVGPVRVDLGAVATEPVVADLEDGLMSIQLGSPDHLVELVGSRNFIAHLLTDAVEAVARWGTAA